MSLLLMSAALVAGCAGTAGGPRSECRGTALEYAVHEGAAGDGFFTITGLAVGSDGSSYLLDSGEGSLIAFDPEGYESWRVGGAGPGPVELLDATGLHRVGELLVSRDLGHDRLSYWSDHGESVEVIELEGLALPGYAGWIAGVGGGRVAAVVVPDLSADDPRAYEGALVLTPGPAGGSGLDTLATLSFPAPQLLELGDHSIPVVAPFAPRPAYTSNPDGLIAVTAGGEYQIMIFDREGRPHAEIVGPELRAEPTAEERQAFARLLPASSLTGQLEFPERLPAITLLEATADGHLLVRTSWTRRDQVRWDRWTTEGEFVDSFLLPASMSLVTGVGNLIYGRAEDEVGAHHLEVYRLTGAANCPGPGAGKRGE
jgi:hypothetical protein